MIRLLDKDPALEAPQADSDAAGHAGRSGPPPADARGWPPLEELVRCHYREVHRLLSKLLSRPEDADDLAQECFVRAERARGTDAPPRAFLLRTATNLAHDLHRSRGRRGRSEELPGDTAGEHDDPAGKVASAELMGALRSEVAGLPDPPRSSFVARVLLGQSYEAVAHALGLEPGTVRIHVMKARRLLEKRLAPWLEEPA